MITHEVLNQVPPREGVDEYAANVPLAEAVARWGRGGSHTAGAGGAASVLHDLGRHVGSAAFQLDAERANTHPPVLQAHDRWGNRIDEVEYDDAYHRVIAASIGAGAHTSAWADRVEGRRHGFCAATAARAIGRGRYRDIRSPPSRHRLDERHVRRELVDPFARRRLVQGLVRVDHRRPPRPFSTSRWGLDSGDGSQEAMP